jgi:nucleoside-diphosphate-sugar epimerase
MKILITGHRGFVGKHFTKFYRGQGHEVFGVDIAAETPREARDFFRKDDIQWDLVIHLAAVVGGRAKIEGDPLSVAVDLSIDAEMWQWAIRTKQKRVVYFSSSAAYPIELQTREEHVSLAEHMINLNDIRSPDFTYGWSKLTGEYLAQFAEAEGVRTHIFRPFSGYGEDQALDYPFPSFIERGKRKADPFDVWGDGMQTRDFVHIDDIVETVNAAIEQDYRDPLNIGTGRPTSFLDLAVMVSKEANYRPTILPHPEKPTGVFWRVADPTLSFQVWQPRITLEEGIRRALLTR